MSDVSTAEKPSMIVPTYYVRHPDDTYSVADPQPHHVASHRPAGLKPFDRWVRHAPGPGEPLVTDFADLSRRSTHET